MTRLAPLLLIFLSSALLAGDSLESVAKSRIEDLIERELGGHYDLLSTEIVGIRAVTPSMAPYEIKAVTARFVAVRNEEWHLNPIPEVIAHVCASPGGLYLFCRPAGHELSGTIEADLANTIDGWFVLNRNHHTLSEFPLSGYLLLGGIPKEGYVLPPKPREQE
ncbi:MAG TPA: hypothetical protein VMS56_02820 [Thermoanaerobaculia bacterium]|nr:hypothetical protein [Thermoanaerobaculia bacterium]